MKPTLIIADDMAAVRDELVRGLQGEFDIVAVAQDGVGALEACLRYHPQAVLLDVIMPNGNGIETAAKIRSEVHPAPKIVMLSGVEEPNVVKAALEAGASDYLFKPLDIKKIIGTLGGAVRELS